MRRAGGTYGTMGCETVRPDRPIDEDVGTSTCRGRWRKMAGVIRTDIVLRRACGIGPPGYDEVWLTVKFAVRARYLSNLTDSAGEESRHVWTGTSKD